MKYNKGTFGLALLKKLNDEPFDIVRFSRWCEQICSANARNVDEELRGILFEISTMEDDPQFEYTKEELQTLAKKLIYEDKLLLNLPKATILEEKWVMCSNCGDTWEKSPTEEPIIICPQCETTFLNPRFKM